MNRAASNGSSASGNLGASLRANSTGSNAGTVKGISSMQGMVSLSGRAADAAQQGGNEEQRKSPWAPIDKGQSKQAARIVSSDGSIMPRPGEVPTSVLRTGGHSGIAPPSSATATAGLGSQARGSAGLKSAGSTAGAATAAGADPSPFNTGKRQGSAAPGSIRGGGGGGRGRHASKEPMWDSRERAGPRSAQSSRGGRGGYGGGGGGGSGSHHGGGYGGPGGAGAGVPASSISAAAAAAALAAKSAPLPPSMNSSKAAQHKATLAAAAAAAAGAKPGQLRGSQESQEAPDLNSERLFGSPSRSSEANGGPALAAGSAEQAAPAAAGAARPSKPGALTAAKAAAAAERAQRELLRQQQLEQEQRALLLARKQQQEQQQQQLQQQQQQQQQQQLKQQQQKQQQQQPPPQTSSASQGVPRKAPAQVGAPASGNRTAGGSGAGPAVSATVSGSNSGSNAAAGRNWRSGGAPPSGPRGFGSASAVAAGNANVGNPAALGGSSSGSANADAQQRGALFGRTKAMPSGDGRPANASGSNPVARDTHNALREQLQRARADLDKERRNGDAAKRELASLRKTNTGLQERLDRTLRDMRDLRRELETVRGDRDAHKRKSSELQREVKAQEQKVREARAALARAQQQQHQQQQNHKQGSRLPSHSQSDQHRSGMQSADTLAEDLISEVLESFSVETVWKEAYDLDEASVKALPYDDAVRPQRKFVDAVDNTPSPFTPRLHYKPHAVTPLNREKLLNEPWKSPYTDEINRLRYANKLPVQRPSGYRSSHNVQQYPFKFVDQEYQLEELARLLESSGIKEVGVAMQNHSFRSYQGFLCLLQISTDDTDFVIDTLVLRQHIGILASFFANPDVVKVLHGAEGAVRWLQRDFDIYVVNMIDLAEAAVEMDLPDHSFAFMLKHFTGKELDTSEAGADWRRRPLSFELLKYAQQFPHYMLDIYRQVWFHSGEDIMHKVFSKSCITALLTYQKRPVSQEVINAKLTELQRAHKDDKPISAVQRGVFAALAHWRDLVARIRDESVDYVMNDDVLYSLAKLGPISSQQLQRAVGAARNPTAPILFQLRGSVLFAIARVLDQPVRMQPRPVSPLAFPHSNMSPQHHPIPSQRGPGGANASVAAPVPSASSKSVGGPPQRPSSAHALGHADSANSLQQQQQQQQQHHPLRHTQAPHHQQQAQRPRQGGSDGSGKRPMVPPGLESTIGFGWFTSPPSSS